ncbi:redoxin family protein [Methylobacterium sp. A54F]
MSDRRAILQTLAVALAAAAVLPAIGAGASAAPEFVGLDDWLNAPAPLTLVGLRGRVVLVDFWTYSCINCRRTVPYLNRWQAEYGTQGLQVVGIHTPEFGFERARTNVADAVRRLGIRFPVGQDNRSQTWAAWGNRAWPTFYLLDRNGRIVLQREGEGHAHEMESAIRALLGLPPAVATTGDDPDLAPIATPEIYFGALHPTPQDRVQRPRQGETTYTLPTAGPPNGVYQLDGTWAREGEALVLRSQRGRLRVRFSAAKLHMVASAPTVATIRVAVDRGPDQAVTIELPTLYTLFDGTTYTEHELVLEAETPGLSLYSATFG